MEINISKNFTQFKNRRGKLTKAIKDKFNANGIILLFAAFEQEKYRFRQDSNFYYLTGLNEPAIALVSDLENNSDIYVPNYAESRAKWVSSEVIGASTNFLKSAGFGKINMLGNPCTGYSLAPKCMPGEFENLIKLLDQAVKDNKNIYTIYDANRYHKSDFIIESLCKYISGINQKIKDISPIVSAMRRTKDAAEIVAIQEAVELSMGAQAAAASVIEPDLFEYEVQAALEFVVTAAGASQSFPTIAATGANANILHYTSNTGKIKEKDLVLVDAGAELNHYCGDLTRTYPASGTFTKRQREVYEIVLGCQEYIASIAAPGFWLNNKNQQDKSLQHLALKFFNKAGFEQYFTHGIGHFLGLDVHDVGDRSEPLKENDVITIEPGLYIPQENLGIRIEDNYVLTKTGVYCMSEDLPKGSYDVEEFMTQEFDEQD